MRKKFLVVLMALVLLSSLLFTACSKVTYTDPQTGVEYVLVTDENGEKVLTDDGELLVYVTDENGKIQKDENGEPLTEIHGFIGQIIENGVVEDYAYKFKIPNDWKTTDEFGVFTSSSLKAELKISVQKYTFNDYMDTAETLYESFSLKEVQEKNKNLKAYWDEFDYENADTKVYIVSASSDDLTSVTMFFENSNNTYQLLLESEKGNQSREEMTSTMLEIYEAFEFKNQTYYEGLTDKVVDSSETTESVSEK